MISKTRVEKPDVKGIDPSLFTAVKGADEIIKQLVADQVPITEATLGELALTHKEWKDAIAKMIDQARGGATTKGSNVIDIRAQQSSKLSNPKLEALVKGCEDRFARELMGCEEIKERIPQLLRSVLRRIERGEKGPPVWITLVGPPSTGKTQTARILAETLGAKLLKEDCGNYKSSYDMYKLFGPPPGTVGFDQEPAFSSASLKASRGMNGIAVIVLDEIDRAEILATFVASMMPIAETGISTTSGNKEIDLTNCFVITTSNAGADTVGEKTGKDARNHYRESFLKALNNLAMQSRAPEIISTDRHTLETSRLTAKKFVDGEIAKILKNAPDIQLEASSTLLTFLGRLGMTNVGPRPVAGIIETLVAPGFDIVLGQARPGEAWSLDLKGTPSEIDALVAAFTKVPGAIPQEVKKEGLPLQAVCTAASPSFYPYNGKLPFDPAKVTPLGYGTVAGRPFSLVSENGENALYVVQAGDDVDGSDDAFEKLVLPDELRNANCELKVAVLDDNYLLFYAVDTPQDAQEPKVTCFLCDVRAARAPKKEAKKTGLPQGFEKVSAPEVAWVQAAFVGGMGKALLVGARLQGKDASGGWAVTGDPAKTDGVPIEPGALLFRLADKKWHWIGGAGNDTPARATAVRAEAEKIAHILGGEIVSRQNPNRIDRSEATKKILSFDFESEKFVPTQGTLPKGIETMPQAVTEPAAFINGVGELEVHGGLAFMGSKKLVGTRGRATLGRKDGWREEALPGLAMGPLMVVPRGPRNWLIGPLLDPNGETWRFYSLRPRDIEAQKGDT